MEKQPGHPHEHPPAGTAPTAPAQTHSPRKEGGFGAPRSFLNNRFAYAVISQRARGLSIGVNMNPDKYCNFSCLYCEVNRDEPGHDKRVNVRAMSAELENLLTLAFQKRMRELPPFHNTPDELLELKEVALSGNGEPTLSPNFPEIVREVVHLRSTGRVPFFKLVLITNGTGLDLPEVQAGIGLFSAQDDIWIKLDAGTQEFMNRVNRPNDTTLEKVLQNILLVSRERPVVIQSLFPMIEGGEPSAEEIDEYVKRLAALKEAGAHVSLVQIYSAHRPPHHPTCGHLPLRTLSKIAQQVREATGLKVEVF